MGQSALLEREYQTFTENEDNTPEAIAHRKRSSEIYNAVFQSKEIDAEKIAAAFSAPAPVAKTETPVAEAPAAPVMAAAVKEAPARRELFSDFEYKDHTLVHTDVKEEVAAPEVAPSFSPVAVPAQEVPAPATETEEDEDLRPTRRTMETLEREELYRQAFAIEQEQRERVGFFASLSSKTKMVLAVLSALFVVAIALVCINTGLINSMKSGLKSKETELQELTRYSEELDGNIERYEDPAFVDDYAEHELGMTRP